VTDDELERIFIPHLRTQFEQGRPILFTGAGFSCAAKNILGEDLPSGRRLKEKLWPICFPDSPFDPDTTLQDLYEYAVRRNRNRLTEVLTQTLSVDPNQLPGWYKAFFSLPWSRIYTLNIDDLESAITRAFELPRKITSVSAVEAEAGSVGQPGNLDVVHLNGVLAGIPDDVTFQLPSMLRDWPVLSPYIGGLRESC
jgi:hypothetical protein